MDLRAFSTKQEQREGFTIVELLIVIVVIAILAAIIVVGYTAVIGNANDKALQADISGLADAVKLKGLDDNGVPPGGATSSNTGNSTIFSGMAFKPNVTVYDTTVSNLYYCAGTLNGNDEFAIAARSKSGKAFSYISNKGVAEFTSYTWTAGNGGVAVCNDLGFTAPFTWSYGFYPSRGWYSWAFNGTILTNLVLNPSMESNITGWANYTGFAAPTRVTTTPWVGAARLSAVGLGTVTTPRVYTDIIVAAGDVISVSFRVRSDGQAATGGYLVAKLINGATEISSFYGNAVSWTPDGSGWVNTTGTFTVPSGGTGIRLSIGLTSAANYSGTMGIDGVIAVESSNIPTYADGNTLRWVWTGTTNNSTSSGPEL